jgi:hypothetical protein
MKTSISLWLLLGLPLGLFSQIASRIHYPSIQTAFVQTADTYIHPNVVLNLGSLSEASLQFDDVGLNYPSYYFRIIHCQADWKPSPLSEIEYLAAVSYTHLTLPTK